MTKRILVLAALTIALIGCGSDPTTPSTGTVTVLLTDAPIDLSGVSAVEVTLDHMVLFGNRGIVDDEDGLQMGMPGVSAGEGLTLNLLDFQDERTATIAIEEVPAGDYKKMRMYIIKAELVMPNPNDVMSDFRYEIDVPSSKVDIPVAFTVPGGESVQVTLDFDAALSVQVNETQGGNKEYILRPVITPIGGTSG
jgi:hypothetical protein